MRQLIIRFFITCSVIMVSLIASGQNDNRPYPDYILETPLKKGANRYCGSRVEKADSVINFAYNPETGEFYPAELRKFTYDSRDNIREMHLISLPIRANILLQVFDYDSDNNQTGYANYTWINGSWEMSLLVTRNFSADNKIIDEVFYNRDASGNFRPYMRHFYEYEGTMPVRYLRQVLNAQGQFYDFSYHNYVYDSKGRLEVLYGQYINGPAFWERTSVYDDNMNRVAKRYLRQLKYDPALKQNVLTNVTYEEYSYNIFGNVSRILYHGWTDGNWSVIGEAIYYYSLIPGKKVSICHNGHTICVSVNAVKAHLEHGDKLGECDNENYGKSGKGPEELKNNNPNEKFLKFSIYPNPASDQVTVKWCPQCTEYKSLFILASDGKKLLSANITGRNEISFNIGNLKSGTYLVRMNRKDGGFDTGTIIKK